MKPMISMAAAAALGFTACSSSQPENTTTTLPPKEIPAAPFDATADARALQVALAPYEVPAQHLQVILDKPADVTGAHGTVVHLDPANLETEDGSPMGKQVAVTLTELTDKTDMIRNNVQTASDGKLLVSGGAYFIACSANGHPLRLKPGKTLSVSFPRKSKEEMKLFYGNRDSAGNMNWKPANVSLRPSYKADSVTEKVPVVRVHDSVINAKDYDKDAAFGVRVVNGEASVAKLKTVRVSDTTYVTRSIDLGKKLEERLYAQARIDKMGWINCDRLYDMPGETTLLVHAPGEYKGKLIRMFIVFKNSNSVLSQPFYPRPDNAYSRLYGLPANEAVRIIAFAVAGGLHTFSKDMVLKDAAVDLDLKPASDTAIRKLLQMGG